MQEGEAVYASNFRRGPRWLLGILKESTGPTSFAVQLEDGRLLRRHQDHLMQRSCAPQASTADQEVPADPIPATPAFEQPELQWEETPREQAVPVQPPTQGIPEKRYPTRNRHAPRYLADFVTK